MWQIIHFTHSDIQFQIVIESFEDSSSVSDSERIVELLRSEDPKPVKGLQEAANYKSEKDITIYGLRD